MPDAAPSARRLRLMEVRGYVYIIGLGGTTELHQPAPRGGVGSTPSAGRDGRGHRCGRWHWGLGSSEDEVGGRLALPFRRGKDHIRRRAQSSESYFYKTELEDKTALSCKRSPNLIRTNPPTRRYKNQHSAVKQSSSPDGKTALLPGMSVSKLVLCGAVTLLAVMSLAAVGSALQQQDMDDYVQRTRRAYFSKKDESNSVGLSDCLSVCEMGYQSCSQSCAHNPGCPLLGCLFKKHYCNKTCYARVSRRGAPRDDGLMQFD
ncbi:Hypp7239 [Branchiostoma lanceolatum]|uniref:Hypp7239 protein n=1 Tax=Branchiostoma lanceolatum TaxID=7740 RepID=A0A8J9YYK8_BRALA|nr:Hypp7239 [Branchiostoma lanceolatum]